jgi:hypothetical protein
VLEADATTLRVLRPRAVWTYHGVDQPYGPSGQSTVYTDVVKHQSGTSQAQSTSRAGVKIASLPSAASASASVTEQASNLFNTGADSSTVQASAGSVTEPASLQPVSSIAADHSDGLQLRSPVLINDQYTLYDRHFDDGGTDVDGDGIKDALDVAIWNRVIGAETITLPNRRQIQAIRVDTTLRERVTFSKTGLYSDTVDVVQRRWYAKGLGIVQMQLEQPGPNVPSVHQITTEQLDTWDGLTEGMGYLPVQDVVVPSGESAGQTILYEIGAVPFDDHAVVLGSAPSQTNLAAGFTLNAFDLRGVLLSSYNYRNPPPPTNFFDAEALLRLGNELRVFGLNNDGIVMQGFDANGQHQTLQTTLLIPGSSLTFDSYSPHVLVASTGNRFWLLWLKTNYDQSGGFVSLDLRLQQFDAAGNAIGAALVLAPDGHATQLKLAADAQHVFAVWEDGQSQYYAVADAVTGALLANKTVSPSTPDSYIGLQPYAAGGALLLTYESDTLFRAAAAVALDASFDPIRSSTGSLGNELLGADWLPPSNGVFTSGTMPGHVNLAFNALVTLWPVDGLDTTSVAYVTDLSPGSGALASTGTFTLLAQVPNFNQNAIIPFSDRLLLIGTKAGGGLVSTVVWRAP